MSESTQVRTRVGGVAIGRNDGERLRACLGSLVRDIDHVLYVDSGYRRRHGDTAADSLLHAAACVAARWPQATRALEYPWNRLWCSPTQLIEYSQQIIRVPAQQVSPRR